MRNLTIKEQIEVLKLAKDMYIECGDTGMCYVINQCLPDELKMTDTYNHLVNCIPSFNIDSLKVAGKNGEIPMPERNGYWWSFRDKTIRPKVFDYLIEELEKLK